MSGETSITIIGNLTADPELRYTPAGAAVANFTIASTPRIFDRQANEYRDGETLFLRASIWREAAENVAESLTRGTRVIAAGVLKPRAFETREGEKRTVVELEVEDIGASLRHATTINRPHRSEKPQRDAGAPATGGGQQEPAADPWGDITVAVPGAPAASNGESGF